MTENSLIDTFNGRIEDLFLPERKYTFLVGAGASMDAPTNMPSAREIVRSLLSFCAPNEEVDNLLSLDLLRYELVVDLFEKLNDNSNKAATLSNIGRIYESQGNYNKALEIYEEAFEIDKQIGDPYGAISDLNNIGRIYETIGDFHEVLTRYEGDLQISTQIGQNQYIEMIQKKITELESKIN